MKFDEIHLSWLKFSTTINDNDNIIDIQKHRHIRAVSARQWDRYRVPQNVFLF